MCGAATSESRRCRVARSSGSLTRVRLIAGFHASSSRKCAVMIAVSAAESSGSAAAESWRASSPSVSRSVGGSALGSVGSGARSGGVVLELSRSLRSSAWRCAPVGPWSDAQRRAPLQWISRRRPSRRHLSCNRGCGLQGSGGRARRRLRVARPSAARCRRSTPHGRPCAQCRAPVPQVAASD